jgi:hypothetical protein
MDYRLARGFSDTHRIFVVFVWVFVWAWVWGVGT